MIEESVEEVEDSNGLAMTKPHKPVMSMVQEEIVMSYSIFLRDLHKIHGKVEKPQF